MILHVTRHGQTDVKSDHPPGDPHLTGLGRRQAEKLGEALKELGFAGAIHSSPYRRTMETAQVVAEVTDTYIAPIPEMREYVPQAGRMETFVGATLSDLGAEYDRVTADAVLPYPWWTTDVETDADVAARVAPAVARAEASGVDVLLVGHGASATGVHQHLLGDHDAGRERHGDVGWNCFLSSFEMAPRFRVLRLKEFGHLPDDLITSNALTREEVLAQAGS